MGSFKSGDRDRKPNRRREAEAKRALRYLEPLEARTLMSGLPTEAPRYVPTSTDIADVKNGPLAKAGKDLIDIYVAFQRGTDLQKVLAEKNQLLDIRNNRVGVDLYGWGDFDAYVKSLRDLGMKIVATDRSLKIVEGTIEFAAIRSVAEHPQTAGMTPIYRPYYRSQGAAANQGELTMRADTARSQFGVDGRGITVGVISDSADRFAGGLQDSINTGDLPPRSRINIVQDEPIGGRNADEGRAMMELIYDIAPGANLAFHTASGGPLAMANGIRALATQAGSQVIVDDVGYFNEPVFQDGIIARAISEVTRNNNVIYFSSAGNDGDAGYETDGRIVAATVGVVGQGRFQDFDPGPGVLNLLPMRLNVGATVGLWWDDPFFTTNGVRSDVDLFVLDAATGAIVAQGLTNNIASGTPQELLSVNPGSYNLAIRVTSGLDITRLRVMALTNTANGATISQQFGSAGGTTYPTTFGHPTSAEAIGVGAVFYNDAPPFSTVTPIRNEVFSSTGPTTIYFDTLGNRLPTQQIRLKPDVSGPDGVNTTFFPPGGDIPQDPDNFPNFFGTSASAPNVAAVAALMKQLTPQASLSQVRTAMTTTATALNGTAPGGFDPRGGFGLVDAPRALASIGQLRVLATTPADGSSLQTVPASITVDFSKPINAASVQPTDLTFNVLPAGVTVQVTGVNVVSPTRVVFQLAFNVASNAVANGTYRYRLPDGAITATDNSALVGGTFGFTLADVIAPRVTSTTLLGRLVVVQFSESMRGSTMNPQNIYIVRQNGAGTFGSPQNVIVTNDTRAVFFYDAPNNRAIYDLRAMSQTALPPDVYALVVADAATDVVGNRLDGEFSGSFPTGNGTAGGHFAQGLGFLNLNAPRVVDFGFDAVSDTGITGDQTTSLPRPGFDGQVLADFPTTNAGLQVAVQIRPNQSTFDLQVGQGGRGFQGNPDFQTVTDSNGFFRFSPPSNLKDGLYRVRIVVYGESDQPVLPGLATQVEFSFRVDTTKPLVTFSSIPAIGGGVRLNSLRDLTLQVADPVAPTDLNDPARVPTQLDLPALDPATATNLSNYSLWYVGPNGVFEGGNDDVDYSNFIRSAQFTSTSNRQLTSDPYTGRIDLTFAEGLPAGKYLFLARTEHPGFFSGLRDAAGNPLDSNPTTPTNEDYFFFINLQPEASYLTGFEAFSPSNSTPGAVVRTGPRSFYEIPNPLLLTTPRAEAPPSEFRLTFSSTLRPNINYSRHVQLIRSANNAGASPDGDFGTGGATGFSTVSGLTVEIASEIPGSVLGQPGFGNQLIIKLPAGTVLESDFYRLVIPNAVVNGEDLRIFDVFGNQADLEFLGNERPGGGGFEVFMPDGTYREGLTGDGVGGGGFATGFVVVPPQRVGSDGRIRGNIVYARPDYVDDPFFAGDDPDGSVSQPFPTLVPEAVANNTNGGDLNSGLNFGTGFNRNFDRNGNGRFDRSAFFEAQQVSLNTGGSIDPTKPSNFRYPVVVVALPGVPRPDPNDPATSVSQPFVISPASGLNPTLPQSDASASVPQNTMLVLNPGTTVKMYNSSLFVQNQGSSLQIRGGTSSSDRVVITSLLDDSIGGDTNRDGNTTRPGGGDWGGIVFRNIDDRDGVNDPNRPLFPVDGRLGRSGADDALSIINFATLRFGGGAVPQTIGTRYDSITLFNSRPAITNTAIVDTAAVGSSGGTQAAISADFDSLREDIVARGPLVRRTSLINNSINGILIRPQLGRLQASQTNAIDYEPNPFGSGSDRAFVIDDPLPYVLASQLVLGQAFDKVTNSLAGDVANRLYIQPGMMIKSRPGASIAVLDPRASINIGDRRYISAFDPDGSNSPRTDSNFQASQTGDAKVLFTSLFDDAATTTYFDPASGVTRTIVPANATDNDSTNPAPSATNVPAGTRWGSLSITPGARAVIDEAEFRFGGGFVNTPFGTVTPRQVLDLTDDLYEFQTSNGGSVGAFVSVTNNDFRFNEDAAILIEPNGLLAADPTNPLASGNPFFRGNLMEGNDINGLAIKTTPGIVIIQNGTPLYVEGVLDDFPNLTVNSVWDDTDITHVLRGTIIAAGYGLGFGGLGQEPVNLPQAPGGIFALQPESVFARPSVVLTIQSALPDTLLANGQLIARPGESIYVKMLNDYGVSNPGPGAGSTDPDLPTPAAADTLNALFGAGFNFGFDDGIDPPATSPLVDPGLGSQLRIVGIGANETTGQQRVPVVMTSLRDATVGPTVRGQSLANTFINDRRNRFTGAALSTPAAGDAGIIGIGSLAQTDYNLYDPRNGSLIDNADIRFIHRIQIQGGNVSDFIDQPPVDGAITNVDAIRRQKLGLAPDGTVDPRIQANSANAMTISNSNLTSFRDAGVFMHPGFDLLARDVTNPTLPFLPATRVGGVRGQANTLFFVNNTVSDMPVGIRINGETTDDTTLQNPHTLVALHNTFYNNGVGIRTDSATYNNNNALSHVHFLVMNNIFEGGARGADPAAAAVRSRGQVPDSELTFNVFNGYATPVDVINTSPAAFLGNNNAIFGVPLFFDPNNGNFFPLAGSAGIDAALSELGPVSIGDAIYPAVSPRPGVGAVDITGGIRNNIGRTNGFGGLGFIADPREMVTLPGSPNRGFVDQFVPVLPGAPNAFEGPATNLATYQFSPLTGERDFEGFLRLDDPATPNIGFGSRPFFDIGARERRVLDPPRVTNNGARDIDGDGIGDAVIATVVQPDGSTQLVNLYTSPGLNGLLQRIEIHFSKLLDPTTVTNSTVLLQAAGGDALFDNRNSVRERFIDLSGRLSFDSASRNLVINVAPGTLLQDNDLYRIRLVGSGGSVIRDPQGNALDGENIDPVTGNQRPLPSGNSFPGGDFLFSFAIDRNAPSIVPNTFTLSPASDSGPRDAITNVYPPFFTGRVTDIFPPANPLVNQTVFLDIDVDGDGNFELQNVGTALTDAQGNFTVTYGRDDAGTRLVPPNLPRLPDTNFNVGPDGRLGPGTGDDSGYSVARIRIRDVSGNFSPTNGPGSIAGYVLDTTAPRITSATPSPNSLAAPTNGTLRVTVRANENLSEASLRAAGSISARRAGQDGLFGTADDVTLTVDTAGLQVTYLGGDPAGPVEVSFNVSGVTTNDIYRITLGSGVTDIAGNSLDGEFTGVFPSGNGVAGGDFNLDLIVFSPGRSRIIYASTSGGAFATGSRNNPYGSINAALAAASIGDTVAVLPGTYNEAVNLKSLVKLVSAATSSTDAIVVPGSAQSTIIRAPIVQNVSTISTVTGTGLVSVNDQLRTELVGFAVASPLTNLSEGAIRTDTIGLNLNRSAVFVRGNIFLNGHQGVAIVPNEGTLGNPVLQSNIIAGNTTGVYVNDGPNRSSSRVAVRMVNNTVAFNNIGLRVDAQANGPMAVDAVNNIFWQNRNREANRGGVAVLTTSPTAIGLRSNLFSANGTDVNSTADDLAGTSLSGGDLGTVPSPSVNAGNYTGNPAFATALDPRPSFDGPTVFLLNENFRLSASSAAIDTALGSEAPPRDFLNLARVDTTNRTFPGLGPADVGAFEFLGSTASSGTGTTPGTGGGTGVPPSSGGGVIFFGTPVPGAATTDLSSTTSPTTSTAEITVQVNPSTSFGEQVRAGRPATAGPGRRAYEAALKRRGQLVSDTEQTSNPGTSSRPFMQFLNRFRSQRRPKA